MGEPVILEEVRAPTGHASDDSPRRSRRRRHRRSSGSASPGPPASPPPLQASQTSDGLTALFAPLPEEAKFAAAAALSASQQESDRSRRSDLKPPAEESALVRDLSLRAPTVTSEEPTPAPVASTCAKEAPPSEVFGGSCKVPLLPEASALTGGPCAVITEATAVTSRAPGVISEASALTSEASVLLKEVSVANGPTPTIISKAPALISEANALIREAEAIQNAVPALTLDSSETSTFKVEAPEIISKAPALITEASALLQEARALISQVPSHLLEGNIKTDFVKNGEIASNFLDKFIAVAPKGHPEEILVPQEEVLSTNSTLAGVDDFDTFELASERDEGTRKSDLRVISGRESEVISKSVEVCGEGVIPQKDFDLTGSEVCLNEESANTELQGDCKLGVEIEPECSTHFVDKVKSLSVAKEEYEECRREKETEEFTGTTTIDSVRRRQKEETIELKSDNIVEGTSNLTEVEALSKQTSSPVLEVEEVATKAELVSPKPRQTENSDNREELVGKGVVYSSSEIVREVSVKKEKLVANQAPVKNKRRKKANVETTVSSAKEGPVAREVTKTLCEPPVEGKVCAKGDTEELVFSTQTAGCAESSPLVGAGEGASEQPVQEVTLTRHPRTDGEEPEGDKASSKQQQGEVPAHELARLLGQLSASGDEMMSTATATAPGDAPASFAAPRADEEESLRMRKDGDSRTGVEAAAARAAAAAGQRDSANHSPAEGMLASPRSHDVCSSGLSGDEEEGDSSDSGKGCSDAPTPPPSRTPASGSSVSGDALMVGCGASPDGVAAAAAGADDDPAAAAAGAAAAASISGARVYEFVLPQQLVGRLIGRHGCFVHQIKARTNASILIKRHPETVRLKVCAIEGSPADVEGALEMIRQKFPEKRYPHVSLEQVCFVSPPLPVVPVLPDCLRLQLVEGISNDVILSSLVSPAHFFLQQPTHPTFPALARLCACMDATYGGEGETPAVPSVQAGIIVAAPVMGSWYRAEVVAAEPNAETCQVRYVDYGGYELQQNAALRQIRSDFMTLPFQAAECYLANVICNSEEEGWSTEAFSAVDQLTAGQVLQAQVCGYCEDGVPAVSLYVVSGSQVISVSQELVARGLGQWWEPTDG